MNSNNQYPHTVPAEQLESAAYLEQLAQEYEDRGQWSTGEIARGAIEHLAEVAGVS